MKEIIADKSGKHCGTYTILVDDEDYEYLSQFKWYIRSSHNSFYAYRNTSNSSGRRTKINIHVDIMKVPLIDHINNNGLDNRKVNLRHCTNRQNLLNRRPNRNCSSSFKGVSWDKRAKKWRSQIKFSDKATFLGCFNTEIEAALTYDSAALKHFGEFAYLNFPR